MKARDVLELWRNSPAAGDWGPGARVKFCLDRQRIYSIHDEEGEILGLLDVSGPEPKTMEFFDPGMQELLLAGLWRNLS